MATWPGTCESATFADRDSSFSCDDSRTRKPSVVIAPPPLFCSMRLCRACRALEIASHVSAHDKKTAHNIPIIPPSPRGDALVAAPPVNIPTSGGSLSDGHGVDVVVPVVVTDGAADTLEAADSVGIARAVLEPDLVTETEPLGDARAEPVGSDETLGAFDGKVADVDGEAVVDDEAWPVCEAADADGDIEARVDVVIAALCEIPVASGDAVDDSESDVDAEREIKEDALLDALTAADLDCDTDALTERVNAGDRDCDADTLCDFDTTGERDCEADTLADRVLMTVAVVERVREGVELLDSETVCDGEPVDDGVAELVAVVDDDVLCAKPDSRHERRDKSQRARNIVHQVLGARTPPLRRVLAGEWSTYSMRRTRRGKYIMSVGIRKPDEQMSRDYGEGTRAGKGISSRCREFRERITLSDVLVLH